MSDISAALPYLAGLNPPQRDAVLHLDGPLLVLAGAGSGKTRVLTARLAQLIDSRRAWPSHLLAVTFTNKAALEMRLRVAELVGSLAHDVWLGTFHALAARILRRHAEQLGLRANFVILDGDDQMRLLKQALTNLSIDDKRWPAKLLLGIIGAWKDRGLLPGQVSKGEAKALADGKAVQLYQIYQERLTALNACDFGDLLLHGLTLFSRHPDILAFWQNKFRYILVDEYQDTNVAQYLWLRFLSQASKNICCVGDEDQSIYGWRGAQIENILRFEKDFPGAKVVRLEQNYRSSAPILSAAAAVIAHNRERLGKKLWTSEQGGEKVRVCAVLDGAQEAWLVANEIEALHKKGHALGQMAILVRVGSQTRAFEERLMTLGLAYRVVGGLRFYERREVRDAIAYLRLIDRSEDDLAFERILNTPRRGLGLTTLQSLHHCARSQGLSLHLAAAHLVQTKALKPQAQSALARFLADFERWRSMARGAKLSDLAKCVLDESGYREQWRTDPSPEAAGRLENLTELVLALDEFDSLGDFLEHVTLATERTEGTTQEYVALMTLHGAKGLEFDTVFLAGWEEGIFPNQRTLEENGHKGVEEERRLAYVGLTRAKKRVTISYAANRYLHGQWLSAPASRFIAELPRDEIEKQTFLQALSGESNGGQSNGGQSNWNIAAKPVADVQCSQSGFLCRQRVVHPKFGYGTVLIVEGDRLEVAFDSVGRKKVIAHFVAAVEG